MVGSFVINWDETTQEERKCLFNPVAASKKRLNISWAETFQQAFGPRDNVGIGYEDNLRKGRISTAKAYKLFVWLARHDSALASLVEDNILARRTSAAPHKALKWDALLAKGDFSNVQAFSCAGGLNMAEFARREPVASLTLKLLEEFYFEMDIPLSGYLIAFQGYKGLWYPQVIDVGTNIIPVSEGRRIIPSNDGKTPEPLWEETDIGKHSYLFLLVKSLSDVADLPVLQPGLSPVPSSVLDIVAEQIFSLPEEDWQVFRINLMFEARVQSLP